MWSTRWVTSANASSRFSDLEDSSLSWCAKAETLTTVWSFAARAESMHAFTKRLMVLSLGTLLSSSCRPLKFRSCLASRSTCAPTACSTVLCVCAFNAASNLGAQAWDATSLSLRWNPCSSESTFEVKRSKATEVSSWRSAMVRTAESTALRSSRRTSSTIPFSADPKSCSLAVKAFASAFVSLKLCTCASSTPRTLKSAHAFSSPSSRFPTSPMLRPPWSSSCALRSSAFTRVDTLSTKALSALLESNRLNFSRKASIRWSRAVPKPSASLACKASSPTLR
mmetsp:Transcript_53139/g.106586  ORF Transcript_53139/g.106586 Transcript_53139/m.106586 type:complete len:282 (-) Transcript_53139:237-1082(-)